MNSIQKKIYYTIILCYLVALNAIEINFIITSDEPECESSLNITFQKWLKVKAIYALTLACIAFIGLLFILCEGEDRDTDGARRTKIFVLILSFLLIAFSSIWYIIGIFIFWRDCYFVEERLRIIFWIDIIIFWLSIICHQMYHALRGDIDALYGSKNDVV